MKQQWIVKLALSYMTIKVIHIVCWHDEKGDKSSQHILENCSFFANIYLNRRPMKQDKEALSTESFHAQYLNDKPLFSSCFVHDGYELSTGFSDGANSVMRHLKSLKVRACEIRSRKEAGCYSIGSKRECRPIEYFFFAFSTHVQYLDTSQRLICPNWISTN